jgi:hypothetical protein
VDARAVWVGLGIRDVCVCFRRTPCPPREATRERLASGWSHHGLDVWWLGFHVGLRSGNSSLGKPVRTDVASSCLDDVRLTTQGMRMRTSTPLQSAGTPPSAGWTPIKSALERGAQFGATTRCPGIRITTRISPEIRGTWALESSSMALVVTTFSTCQRRDCGPCLLRRWSRLWESWSLGPSRRYFVRACVLPHLSPGLRVDRSSPRPATARLWDRSLPSWIIASPGMVSDPSSARAPAGRGLRITGALAINSPAVPGDVVEPRHWSGRRQFNSAPRCLIRVISFAVRRPLSDRGGGGDSKRILRSAMAG